MADANAKLTSDGDLEFEGLGTDQLLAILASNMKSLDHRVAGLEQRIDDKLDNVATKADLQRFGERMSRLEKRIDALDDWATSRKAELADQERGFGAKLKHKLADYTVIALLALGAAAVIGGISFYVSNNNEVTELRRQIDQLRALK